MHFERGHRDNTLFSLRDSSGPSKMNSHLSAAQFKYTFGKSAGNYGSIAAQFPDSFPFLKDRYAAVASRKADIRVRSLPRTVDGAAHDSHFKRHFYRTSSFSFTKLFFYCR